MEGTKGDSVSRKEFVFPFRISVDVKKEKKIGFETDFEKCELISLLFTTGKTKPFQTTQLFEQPAPSFIGYVDLNTCICSLGLHGLGGCLLIGLSHKSE